MESRLWSVREIRVCLKGRNSNYAAGFKVPSSFKYGDISSLVVIGFTGLLTIK